jgi:hypothetical protein
VRDAPDDAVRALAKELDAARAASGRLAGGEPVGVRAVEAVAGRRRYLVALDGPRFLCLDSALQPETAVEAVREAAAAALVVESAEAILDPEALRGLARAGGRVIAAIGPGARHEGWEEHVQELMHRTALLAAWREEPARAVASLPDLDRGLELHAAARRVYEAFLVATEPLVERQGGLDPDLVDALAALERAAAEAGVGDPLPRRLAGLMEGIDRGADEIVDGHLTRLEPPEERSRP